MQVTLFLPLSTLILLERITTFDHCYIRQVCNILSGVCLRSPTWFSLSYECPTFACFPFLYLSVSIHPHVCPVLVVYYTLDTDF